MRIVFGGTPLFAVPALKALHRSGHEIVLVLTQPDRPSGRGLRLTPSAVANAGDALGLSILKPPTLKSSEVLDAIALLHPDMMVVAAYGLILPKSLLAIPARGCINIHASLLPRWRGAAPVQRAILAGDVETGVSIMVMEPGLDTGPVLLERRVPIRSDDTAASLTDTLAELGAVAIVDALSGLDSLVQRQQDSALASYAAKVEKRESGIHWSSDAVHVDRQIRAFNPFPGAETHLGMETLKVWRAHPVQGSGVPGTVIGAENGRPVVACGHGALVLTVVQRPGSHRLPSEEFVKARPIPVGTVLGSNPSTAG